MNPDWDQWSTYLPIVVAAALVLLRPLWPLSRHAVTLAHEAGHAIAAVATGRRLTGIRLHSDTSGLTLSRGKPRGPGMVLTAAAGYLAPSLLGLGGAALVAGGWLRILLWGTVGLMVVMLPFIRNLFGLLVLVVSGAAFGVVAYFGSASLQLQFGYVAIWLLLIGNLRTVVEAAGTRSGHSDLDQLRNLTHLPRWLWVVLLAGVCVGTGVLAWRAQYLV
ncbi:M50 family metallopeptidase [Rhodococcus spelaei]|uniref:M50 family metallopeptidase n=1 Tax=Rhodococcus spelaei TaxID=2546320 RepID=A0A541B9V0_9NOCA|nr:M50 family metallopeptidase [Rhodococcus spelaei]TQF69121.1 M50 family metallopeptidase [Rhodococcus spelaei]